MKRLLLFLLITLAAILATGVSADMPSYSFSIEDAVPQEIQQEIIAVLTGKDGLIGFPTKKGFLTSALEIYLNCFGIYPPVSRPADIVPWLQETLSSLDRVTEIPQRYVTDREIQAWLLRFAEPGDLLLYRANGQPDRCLIYAGNGKYIGKKREKYALTDVPATFITSDGRRTPGSGLYAIGRIWSDPETDPSVLEFISDPDATAWTGKQYILLLFNPDTGFYEPSAEYIVFEFSPGVFRLWDGRTSGVFPEKLTGMEPLCLTLAGQNDDQMTWRFRFTLDNVLEQDEKLQRITLPADNPGNLHRWRGTDLLHSLASESR